MAHEQHTHHVLTMQLFHELKQKFPAVPDVVVSDCINENLHNLGRCEEVLFRENQRYLYLQGSGQAAKMHASSSGGGGGGGCATGSGIGGGGANYSHLANRLRDFSLNNAAAAAASSSQPFLNRHVSHNYAQHSREMQICSGGGGYVDVNDVDGGNGGGNSRQSSVSMFVGGSSGYGLPLGLPRHERLRSDETRYDPNRSMYYNVHNYEFNVNYSMGGGATTPPVPPQRIRGTPPTATVAASASVAASQQQPPPPPRRVSRVEMEPVPAYYAQHHQKGFWDPSPSRPYTSVNLTLRPPSSEPQAPIDIKSEGSSLTYSTSSFDPKQGYQSRLQIEIGPSGGCISAVRTRVPTQLSPAAVPPPTFGERPSPPTSLASIQRRRPHSCYEMRRRSDSLMDDSEFVSLPLPLPPPHPPSSESPVRSLTSEHGDLAYTQALCLHQMDRKRKLERELIKEKEKLFRLKEEVQSMEHELDQKRLRLQNLYMTPRVKELQKLRNENRKLRVECECMTREVDLINNGQVPLGETSEEFYKNINTGQEGPVLIDEPSALTPHTPASNFVDPGGGRHESMDVSEGENDCNLQTEAGAAATEEDVEGPHWTCSMCTFHNHPALDKCEQCEMPRIMLDNNT